MPSKDGGYAHDWYHPRFVAALLIIGDGLDLDNDRFHLFMEDFSGADFITETTITHINKHRSIRTLQISPRKIEISADCKTAESLRTLCNEIRWLEGFLKNCTYKWNEIAPENFSGSLPNISLNPIRLNGTEIPAEMVTTRFAISQEKAFSLLQGSHIYNSHFTFLRELIQNACDAVKLQYWEDYSASTYTGNVCSANPQEANASIALSKYPIYIYLSVKKLSSGFEPELSDITGEDLKNIKQLKETHKFGVLLEVQDFGIGISKNDIKEIAKVGTSHARQKTAIQKMPSWLRPTGHFGVGLQSLFLVCNNFKCITKTRSGECYDMTFHSRMNQDGYINVIPHPGVDSKGNTIPYGSRFSVFIEETFKESHETNMDGWAAIDPYRPDYEMLRSLRRSVELMLQLESAVDDFLGEMLFPIHIYRYPLDNSLEQLQLIPSSDVALTRDMFFNVQKKHDFSTAKATRLKSLSAPIPQSPSCWLYSSTLKKDPLSGVLSGGSAYLLDFKKAQLHIWSQEAQTFFVCGSQRIQNLTHRQNLQSLNSKRKSNQAKTKLFIKGLFICNCPDNWIPNTFIQFIDVKSDTLNSYLQMNRDGLTAEGSQYLTDTLLPTLTKTLRMVLSQISQTTIQQLDSCKKDIIHKVHDEYALCLQENDDFRDQKLAVIDQKLESVSLLDYGKKIIREKFLSVINKSTEYAGLDTLINSYFLDLYTQTLGSPNNELNTILDSTHVARERLQQIFVGQPDSFSTKFMLCVLEKMLYVRNFSPKSNQKKPENIQLYALQDAVFSVQQMAFLCAMALLEVAQIHDSLHDDKANGCVHPGEDLPCIWAYLNEQMEQLMNSVDESLKDKASDFHGDVSETWHEYACVPTLRWDTLSQVRWKSISEIFDSKHHYAIFSNRTSSGSKWLHALVEIPDYAWDLLNESPQTEDFCNKHWHKLNQWCQAFVNDLINAWDVSPSGRDNTVGRRKNESTTKLWESPVVRWMIHSIPSIALASDIGGMNRLNVLSLHARPSIYKDSHMINLLLDRMRHLSEDRSIERMQLLTLDGLSALNVTDSVTSNIIPATRGCVSSENKKNRMLMAFGSSLPQAVTLSLETMDADNANNPITSVYQLFDALKEPYHTGDSRFLPDKAKFILKVCKQAAWQAEPFYKNVYANIDDKLWNRIVRVHKCFLNEEKRPEGSSLDLRYQESPNQRQLLNIMQKAYEGILTDADQSLKGVHQDSSLKWSDIEFLSNPEKFFNTVILQIFGYAVFPSQIKGSFLPMSNAVAEDFAYYDDYNTYKNEISKVWNGIRYLRDFAADDYENAFVKLVLNWWEDAIWNKDSCSETLLNARASDLRTAISKEDLKHMYLRQIEFFIRSVVSDVPSAVNQYKLERWASITSKEE